MVEHDGGPPALADTADPACETSLLDSGACRGLTHERPYRTGLLALHIPQHCESCFQAGTLDRRSMNRCHLCIIFTK